MPGSPLTFKCGKCRRRFMEPPRITGRYRVQRTAFGSAAAYEYECGCGNVGWTIHRSVSDRAVREGCPSPQEVMRGHREARHAE